MASTSWKARAARARRLPPGWRIVWRPASGPRPAGFLPVGCYQGICREWGWPNPTRADAVFDARLRHWIETGCKGPEPRPADCIPH